MKTIGWRSVLYAAAVLLPCGLLVALSAYTGRHLEISQSFYVAVAQILPILLLAQVLRVNSVHSFLFASRERLDQSMKAIVARVEAVRTEALDEGADETLLSELEELESEVSPVRASTEGGMRQAETVIQLLYGCAFATWVLVIGGGTATLTALAMKDDSLPIFITTVLAVAWLTISLPMLELLLLSFPRPQGHE
jgi:hypothetical protein